jgi:hypothetical protein
MESKRTNNKKREEYRRVMGERREEKASHLLDNQTDHLTRATTHLTPPANLQSTFQTEKRMCFQSIVSVEDVR